MLHTAPASVIEFQRELDRTAGVIVARNDDPKSFVAVKLQCNAPKSYSAAPTSFVLAPNGATVKIVVTGPPEGGDSKHDKFLLRFAVCAESAASEVKSIDWKRDTRIQDKVLKCVFPSPPETDEEHWLDRVCGPTLTTDDVLYLMRVNVSRKPEHRLNHNQLEQLEGVRNRCSLEEWDVLRDMAKGASEMRSPPQSHIYHSELNVSHHEAYRTVLQLVDDAETDVSRGFTQEAADKLLEASRLLPHDISEDGDDERRARSRLAFATALTTRNDEYFSRALEYRQSVVGASTNEDIEFIENVQKRVVLRTPARGSSSPPPAAAVEFIETTTPQPSESARRPRYEKLTASAAERNRRATEKYYARMTNKRGGTSVSSARTMESRKQQLDEKYSKKDAEALNNTIDMGSGPSAVRVPVVVTERRTKRPRTLEIEACSSEDQAHTITVRDIKQKLWRATGSRRENKDWFPFEHYEAFDLSVLGTRLNEEWTWEDLEWAPDDVPTVTLVKNVDFEPPTPVHARRTPAKDRERPWRVAAAAAAAEVVEEIPPPPPPAKKLNVLPPSDGVVIMPPPEAVAVPAAAEPAAVEPAAVVPAVVEPAVAEPQRAAPTHAEPDVYTEAQAEAKVVDALAERLKALLDQADAISSSGDNLRESLFAGITVDVESSDDDDKPDGSFKDSPIGSPNDSPDGSPSESHAASDDDDIVAKAERAIVVALPEALRYDSSSAGRNTPVLQSDSVRGLLFGRVFSNALRAIDDLVSDGLIDLMDLTVEGEQTTVVTYDHDDLMLLGAEDQVGLTSACVKRLFRDVSAQAASEMSFEVPHVSCSMIEFDREGTPLDLVAGCGGAAASESSSPRVSLRRGSDLPPVKQRIKILKDSASGNVYFAGVQRRTLASARDFEKVLKKVSNSRKRAEGGALVVTLQLSQDAEFGERFTGRMMFVSLGNSLDFQVENVVNAKLALLKKSSDGEDDDQPSLTPKSSSRELYDASNLTRVLEEALERPKSTLVVVPTDAPEDVFRAAHKFGLALA